ncbi:MAG: ribosome maturation factor RimP [Chitinispirillales bacterium]|jgi:ribosome maturation factor RimP|nr:ribosome maturation factor RimP [Chitinispirillales bacterium]
MASPLDSVRPFIEAAVAGQGVELFDVRFFGSGLRSVLRVTIDRAGGVTVADCERVSSAVGAALDERDFFDGRSYTLEVSSPGADRLLKAERDFVRIVGREAVLNLSVAVGGKRTVRGVIAGCEDGAITIDTGTESIRVPLADIVSGREELRFG